MRKYLNEKLKQTSKELNSTCNTPYRNLVTSDSELLKQSKFMRSSQLQRGDGIEGERTRRDNKLDIMAFILLPAHEPSTSDFLVRMK